MTFTRQPLLWAGAAFASGAIAENYIWRPPLWWFVAAVVFAVGAAVFRRSNRAHGIIGWTLAVASLVAIGAWASAARDGAPKANDLHRFATGDEMIVTAHVTHDGVLRGKGSRQRQTVDLETESIEADGSKTVIASGLRITVYKRGPRYYGDDEETTDAAVDDPLLPPVFLTGQRLSFPLKIREPRNFQNPGAWDYRGYLLDQGIVATGAVAADKIEVLPGEVAAAPDRWRSRARRSVLGRIHRLWPQDDASLFDAMLIGERSFLSRETSAAWQRTGIYHILVVSGMNVGIFAVVIFWVLRRFRAGEVVATLLTVLLSAAYAYLADAGTPVLRSVLMLTVFLCARLLYRNRALLNTIGGAALVLLVANPRNIFDASFQLTFLSVAAIGGIALPVIERLSDPYRNGLNWLFSPAFDLSVPPRVAQFRLDLRMIAERIARLSPVWRERVKLAVGAWMRLVIRGVLALFDVVVVSASAQLAMTLPMTFYFHRATIVALPANMLAVPLTGVLMSSSTLALALSYIRLPLARIPALVAGWSLAAITRTVSIFADMHAADLRLPAPALLPSLAAAIAVIVAMLLMRRRALLACVAVLALVAANAWLTLAPAQPQIHRGVLEVTAIDVGQGDSLLVVTPDGHTLLVDAAGQAGPFGSDFDYGEEVVAPYLWARGITHVDAIALSHGHSDHIGGMASVIAAFRPRALWLGPAPNTDAIKHVRDTAQAYGAEIVSRAAGQRFDFGGAKFEVLAPPPDYELKDKAVNNDSMVMRVTYGRTSALLAGDVEKKVEEWLAERHPEATLLKVAHHGSKTSTNPEFLSAVHPRMALISVGHNNFGHPRMEVLERLSQAHVSTYRTDMAGAVTFMLDGKSVSAMPSVLR